MTTVEKKNRLEYLDALRGGAAFSVCIYHLMDYMYKADSSFYSIFKEMVFDHIDFGRFGVVLFFLISGFIIPSSLKPNTSLWAFLISRTTRLYPAYWATCFLIIVSAPYFGQNSYGINQVLANLTMIPKIFHYREISGVFWTLFIEILFYVMCATLFQCKLLEKVVVLGIIAILLNVSTPIAIFVDTFFSWHIPIQFMCFHLSFLFIGSVFKQAVIQKSPEAIKISLFILLLLLVTIPLTTGVFFHVSEAINSQFVIYRDEATSVSYFLAIAVFIFVIYYKPLANRFWIFVGEISYSLYLLHMLCFQLVLTFLPPTSLLNSVFFVFTSIFFSLSLAKLSFNFIERPAIALGKKLVVRHLN